MMNTLLPEKGFVKVVSMACLSVCAVSEPSEPHLPPSIFSRERFEDAPSQISAETFYGNLF